ncbi:MAG: hypothetical protein RLZZ416_188 [Candidatus Parcubacteria bacterium]|jgi:hypothetical protein
MKIFTAALVVLSILLAGMWWTGNVTFFVTKPKPAYELSPSQLHERGMSSTHYESTAYVGMFPLVSDGVIVLGKTRKVVFKNSVGWHLEALVTCERPQIEDRTARIYQRVNYLTGHLTYYVVCDVKPTLTRRIGPG